jgi:tripartite-type tricarboxylate transporter receptor subunit TctC
MLAGTPKEMVATVNAEVNKLLATTEMKAAIHAQGAELLNMTPEQFSVLLKTDYQK